MAILLFMLAVLLVSFFLYRYIPVNGLHHVDLNDNNVQEEVIVVDTRDYQTSARDQAYTQAHCLPFPYLRRYYKEIPNKKIVLITSDEIERNLSTRLLRKKGYQVIGYTIPVQTSKPSVCRT